MADSAPNTADIPRPNGVEDAVRRSVYVVGDIHGCYVELLRLEESVRAHAALHRADAFFVCVGDLVDRGPNVKAVVEHVRNAVGAGTHACVAGNHEALMIEVLLEEAPWNFEAQQSVPKRPPAYAPGLRLRRQLEDSNEPFEVYRALSIERWMRCGGRQTLVSFGCDPYDKATWRFDSATLAFLVGLPLVWENETCVVTHALASAQELSLGRVLQARGQRDPVGFHGSLALKEARVLDALLWNREFPPEAPDATRVHVTGHTPLERPFRDPRTGVVNVDTACVFGNLLTAFCVDTGEFVSVEGWAQSPFV